MWKVSSQLEVQIRHQISFYTLYTWPGYLFYLVFKSKGPNNVNYNENINCDLNSIKKQNCSENYQKIKHFLFVYHMLISRWPPKNIYSLYCIENIYFEFCSLKAADIYSVIVISIHFLYIIKTYVTELPAVKNYK